MRVYTCRRCGKYLAYRAVAMLACRFSPTTLVQVGQGVLALRDGPSSLFAVRRIYLIAYDVCEPKRLRQTFKCLKNWGDHLQYSVFECHLTPTDLIRCKAELAEIIHHGDDQVLVVDLGSVENRSDDLVQAIGKPYSDMAAPCIVV